MAIAEITETKRMVQVTEEDIVNGERSNMFRCPIALSIERSIPGTLVEVWASIRVYFEDGSMVARKLTDQESDFVTAFDSGLDVEPIEIEIPGDREIW